MSTATETTEKQMPTWDDIRDRLGELSGRNNDWAGIPLPVEGMSMVVEPRYPYQGLQEEFAAEHLEHDTDEIASSLLDQIGDEDAIWEGKHWYSTVKRRVIWVWKLPNGKHRHWIKPEHDHLDMELQTLRVAASPDWSIDAECAALAKLGELVGQHKLKLYMMTGMFLETSDRSHVTYIFRRLRPTLAVRFGKDGRMDRRRILAALCMHPIGFYERSWAGAMVPTDDVIAHLVLMRGDEHRFWRHANQHDPNCPAAGV